MEFQNLLYKKSGGHVIITINRPDKLNALNKATIQEIGLAITTAEADTDVRAIILTGSGEKSFVAGADISEFKDLDEKGGAKLAMDGQLVFNKIEQLSKPVIAGINGFALGGGCELAMACHLRIAATNAKFGQPEVKLGLIPGYGGTQRLPRLIGPTKALELLMTTDMIGSNQALELGLVNYVTEPNELIDKCVEIANKISMQAPLAISSIIKAVNSGLTSQNGFTKEIDEFGKCFVTKDFIEGATAFMEKRKPQFKGE